MNGDYLSNIVDINDIKNSCLNLIEAPCGSGKTYFIKENHTKMSPTSGLLWTLYLIDTVAGKEAILKTGKENYDLWTNQLYWEINGIVVMTYAGFATKIMYEINNNKKESWLEDSLIICDELHDCIKYSKWSNDNNIHFLALQFIKQRINKSNILISLSATTRKIKECFNGYINKVNLNGIPKHYTNNKVLYYRSLSLLIKQIEKGKRGIIFLSQIREIEKYVNILRDNDICCEGIWSTKREKHTMSSTQIKLRDYILEKQCIPYDIDILLLNAAYETSINIQPVNPIDFMIIHTTDEDTQIQVRGRYRDDLNLLYLPSNSGKLQISVPNSYINRPLYKKDKDELCKLFQIKNDHNRDIKWPTIKKALTENGYIVEDCRTNSNRYSVINM